MSELENKSNDFPFGKQNFILLAIGFVIILVGFMLMSGGSGDDPNVFYKEIFSFRRIVLAPVVVIVGFVFEIYAIMKKTKE